MTQWRAHVWGGWGNLGYRIPQVVVDYDGKVSRYEDGTSEASANIPPVTNVTGAWVQTDGKTAALIQANPLYCVDIAVCLGTPDPAEGVRAIAPTDGADLTALRTYLGALGVAAATLDDNLGTTGGRTADALRKTCVTWCRTLKAAAPLPTEPVGGAPKGKK